MEDTLELQNLPHGHVSYSQINMYKRCPYQWKFRHIDGLIMPIKSSLVIGPSVHEGLTEGFNTKLTSGGDDMKIVNLIKEKTAYEVEQIVATKEIQYEEGETKEVIKDDAVKMSEVYYKELGKKLKPVEVKKPFEITFKNVEWKLVGEIDIVTDELIDWKTGRQKLNEGYLLYDEQLKIYKIVVPKKPVIHQIVRYRRQDPKIFIYETDYNDKILQDTLQNIAAIVQLMRTGIVYKRNDARYCSWCGYKDICQPQFNEGGK